MKYEELSFFNQQLAAMLASGLPLEGSLKQISESMARGPLRMEVEALEKDLEQGMSLDEAIGRRKFPELYIALVRVGVKSTDLPGTLTMMADYYRRLDTIWSRLKGLLVYPAIVLVTALIISAGMALLYTHMIAETNGQFFGMLGPGVNRPSTIGLTLRLWLPVIVLGLLTLVFLFALSRRGFRQWLRWRIPGFHEASLAQLASALAIMLENGCDTNSAVQLVENAEQDTRARAELHTWRQRLGAGSRRFADVARGRLVPPLFTWLVASAGENWAAGFRRAADVYTARANYRIELALYAALPLSILLVTALVAMEMSPVVSSFIQLMNSLGDGFGDL